MRDRQAAFAVLVEYLSRSDEEPQLIFDARVADCADVLRETFSDSWADPDAAVVLGHYHWLRLQLLPHDESREDASAVVHYVMPLYVSARDLVPPPIRQYLDSEIAAGAVADVDPVFVTDRAIEAFTYYQGTGDVELLTRAVMLLRFALSITPDGDPERSARLSNLGAALRSQFERTGDVEILAEAVRVGRNVAASSALEDPNRVKYINSLAASLSDLYERTADLSVLIEAVENGREAAAAMPDGFPDAGAILSNLGVMLRRMFERTDDLAALDEAVRTAREAVAVTPAGDASRGGYLSNLGIALRTLFERTGRLSALTESLQVGRAAVNDTAPEDPNRANRLQNLADTLSRSYERTGELTLLVEAVQVCREALAASPEGHPRFAARLSSLGTTLKRLFERTGESDVLNEAVRALRGALAATPEGHPHRAIHLNNLGATLRNQFERTGELSVLAEAVEAGREAVALTPADHPGRAGRLSNLGDALGRLFERTGAMNALAEAVEVGRQAVAATAQEHPLRGGRLHNLGINLRMAFDGSGEVDVLVEAVQASRDAVAAVSGDHPERAVYLNELGGALRRLFEHSEDADTFVEMRRCYQEAASSEVAATVVRIAANRQCARLALEAGDAQEALRAMESAADFINVLVPGSLARSDREYQLGELADLPSEAAEAALQAGIPERAVELLERTRGILAADSLGLHGGELDRLRSAGRGDLAERLEELRDRLDRLDSPDAASTMPAVAAASEHQLGTRRRQAHAAWRSLLDEIRALPGFADAFAESPVRDLVRHMRGGPVVFVTAARTRADALILADAAEPVVVVELPRLARDEAERQANRLLTASRTVGSHDADPVSRLEAQREILDVLAWLWNAVASPVLSRLGRKSHPAEDTPLPRIWWCPVGAMASLPLHAAGLHNGSAPNADPETVADLVVSSYTPTIRAVTRTHATAVANSSGPALIIPEPDLGAAALHGVGKEVEAIRSFIPQARVLHHPTRAGVLDVLAEYRIVHFSCHSAVDWEQPARSRLILADHATDPLTLADITPLRLKADLAYLSVCETAVAPRRLADESLHITGALLLAGYQHVIGTLWPIDENAAAQIAAEFYDEITNHGTTPPVADKAARALHRATTRLRNRYPVTPNLWVAYTHTGI